MVEERTAAGQPHRQCRDQHNGREQNQSGLAPERKRSSAEDEFEALEGGRLHSKSGKARTRDQPHPVGQQLIVEGATRNRTPRAGSRRSARPPVRGESGRG